jgi:predicted nucleic acid-binding protein
MPRQVRTEQRTEQFFVLLQVWQAAQWCRVALKQSGRPIPANHAWIAALALEYGLKVLSRDHHFDVVPDLERKTW